MTIAAPALTMIAANDLTMTATAAMPRTRIAMTATVDPDGVGAVVAVRARPATANAPMDLALLPPALLHHLVLRQRDATVAGVRAGRLTEAASPTEDSPPPEARLIADRLPLAAMVAPPSNHSLNPSPKADAGAANVAASAALPGIASRGICKMPLSRPAMSSANWSR
jgi:hypothetical protein